MNIIPLMKEIGIAVFGILAVAFGFLSLNAIKRDPRYPPNEARRKSLIKSTINLFLCFISLALLAMLLTPNSLGTVILCLIAGTVVLVIYVCIMFLQYRVFNRYHLDKKYDRRESRNNPSDTKEEKNMP